MTMKHSLVHIFWNVLLVLCACWGLQTDAENSDSDLCQSINRKTEEHCYHRDVSGQMQKQQECGEMDNYEDEDPPCLLYPTNILNCTINPFLNGSQASASIRTCDSKKEAEILETGVTVKSASLVYTVKDIDISSVILRINVSLPDTWIIYYNRLEIDNIEVLSPPANINVSMINGSLVVRWDLPVLRSNEVRKADSFDCELDINGDKKQVTGKQLYEVANVNAELPYKVKLRTKKNKYYSGPQHWSEWSDTITLDPSTSTSTSFNWVILGIVLGIPMILLSVLLLVRSCRESNVLFPRVPQPPIKYKAYLENDAALHFSPAVQSPDSVERISEVEETVAAL